MEDKPLSRGEHEEYRQTVEAKFKAVDDENRRQNARIEKLEAVTDQINELAISVHELAQSVRTMSQTQAKEGARLEALEDRDGQKWRDAVKIVATALVSALIGAAFFDCKICEKKQIRTKRGCLFCGKPIQYI